MFKKLRLIGKIITIVNKIKAIKKKNAVKFEWLRQEFIELAEKIKRMVPEIAEIIEAITKDITSILN